MLITCPECSHSVSDKATACPNCGYPILPEPTKKTRKKPSTRHKRLPNGFGRITEIKNKNLRKPFRAMVTEGKDSTGKPIGKLLKPESYFATYNEAYKALLAYHENPYDFANTTTMSDLYDRWYGSIYESISDSRRKQIGITWSYCDSIKNILVQDIRIRDVKNMLDTCSKKSRNGETIYPSEKFKRLIKMTLSLMLDYAVEYEMIDHNFIKDIKLRDSKNIEIKNHISFTDDEMKTIIDNARNDSILQMMLINCYTGCRPSELLSISVHDVNIMERFFTCGSKTAAGMHRTVPIHSKILPYITDLYNKSFTEGRDTLFTIKYAQYRNLFVSTVKKYNLDLNHKPHDCRKEFVTMAKKSGVDEYAIKKIVGHSVSDLTERVYTDRDLTWLLKEVEKIQVY